VYGLLDSTGAMAEKYHYSAYGKPVIKSASGTTLTSSALGNTYMYTGRNYDIETGLHFFRNRYYSDVNGRFISRDPIGYKDGMSLYRGYFVPYTLDPLGLYWGESWVDSAVSVATSAANAVGNVVVAAVAGAITGGSTGMVAGGVGGAVVGSIGAGVGALPGAAIGGTAGGIAGAIGGALAGAVSAVTNMVSAGSTDLNVGQNLNTGGNSGIGAGLVSSIGAAGGVAAASTTSAVLTHFTTAEAAGVISSTQILGKCPKTCNWATTGQWVPGIASKVPVPITGAGVGAFNPVLPVGLTTAFGSAAGYQSAGSGLLNLATGTAIGTTGFNTQLATYVAVDCATSAVIGNTVSLETPLNNP
jgi:RHS repeat-associated protein